MKRKTTKTTQATKGTHGTKATAPVETLNAALEWLGSVDVTGSPADRRELVAFCEGVAACMRRIVAAQLVEPVPPESEWN